MKKTSAKMHKKAVHKSTIRKATRTHWSRYLLVFMVLVVLYIPFSKKINTARLRAISQAPLTQGSLTIQKFEWHEQDAKKAMIPPRPSTHYITVDAGIEHSLESPAWFAPAVESYVVNSAGTKRSIELVLHDNPFEARSYAARELASGSLAYLVGNKDQDLQWCYRFTAEPKQKDLCIPLNSYNHRTTL
jgi:hypothetical protein